MNELELLKIIEEIFLEPIPGVEVGIGDDGAVFRPSPGYKVVVSSDSMVENVHFDFEYMEPLEIAPRIVLSNVSDIVAMGGIPRFILLSIIAPETIKIQLIEEILRGIKREIKRWKLGVIGGNISLGKELSFTVTIIGEVEGIPLLRNGAQVGDKIYVTGEVGGASIGRVLLKNRKRGELEEKLIKKFLYPEPPLNLILNLKSLINSAIDISDGLILDLKRLITLSGCGARVYLDKLPLPDGYENFWQFYDPEDKWGAALTGGEDYEVLFTSSKLFSKEIELQQNLWGRKVYAIGEITDRSGEIEVIDKDGNEYRVKGFGGWVHKF